MKLTLLDPNARRHARQAAGMAINSADFAQHAPVRKLVDLSVHEMHACRSSRCRAVRNANLVKVAVMRRE
ncbi:MAG: hypothetical protein ABWY07_05380 [Burkholderiales bacterium]